MITLKQDTVELIRAELASIPEKYHTPFHSVHEGLGVLREEYLELEQEMFFGEKKAYNDALQNPFYQNQGIITLKKSAEANWKDNIRKEAVQVAAMAIRIIQELT